MLAADYSFEICTNPKSAPSLAIYDSDSKLDEVLSYEKGRELLICAIKKLVAAIRFISIANERIFNIMMTIAFFDFTLRSVNFFEFVGKLSELTDEIVKLHQNLNSLKGLGFQLITEVAEKLSLQLQEEFPDIGIDKRRIINGCILESKDINKIASYFIDTRTILGGNDETQGISDYLEDWKLDLKEVLKILDTEYLEFRRRQRQIKIAKKKLRRNMICIGKWYYTTHKYKVY